MTREMKNSGIEWIGDIPSEWEIGRVKNAFTRKNEKAQQEEPTILSLARSGVKVRDVSTGEGQIAESYYNYNPVEPFDLLLNPMDLYSGANCSISKVYGVISPAYINLKANKNYYPVFYDYYFKTQYWAMVFFAHGKGVSYDNRWTLSTKTLMNYYIPVPKLHEQKRIADFLDSKVTEIDKIISETKASIENYKEYKQSVITEAVTKGLDKNVPMKDSGIEWIGEIPTHYRLAKFSRIITNTMNGLTRRDLEVSVGEIVLRLKNIGIGKIDYSDLNRIKLSENEKKTYALNNGDFLFVRVNGSKDLVGKCVIYEEVGEIVAFNDHIIRVEFNQELVDTQFILWYLQSKNCKFDISHHIKTSAGQYTISSDGIKDLRLVYSPLREQREISEYLNSKCREIDNLILEKEKLITNLEEYKKSLIYEYVTGKKTILMSNDDIRIVAPIYPAVYNTKKARFAQAILMCKILDTSNNNKGRVKLEKMLFTIENHIGFDFKTEYTRDVAGPFDKSIYECEGIIGKKHNWFKINEGKGGVSYKSTKETNEYIKYYKKYFADYNTEIERIITIFDDFDTEQAEVIATLYGAWNDFLIDKKTFTDDDVVNNILCNWHESKKRFSKDVWLFNMNKMRTLGLVPKGYGKKTAIKEV